MTKKNSAEKSYIPLDQDSKELKKKEYYSLKEELTKLNNFYESYDYMKISIAPPEQIQSWGQKDYYYVNSRFCLRRSDDEFTKKKHAELRGFFHVQSYETLNFKLDRAIPGGLFCPYNFGPEKSWDCYCGKVFKKFKTGKGKNFVKNLASLDGKPNYRYFCSHCLGELTDNRVRRYRMSFCRLNNHVAHFWYHTGTSGVPNYLVQLLRLIPVSDEFSLFDAGSLNEILINPYTRGKNNRSGLSPTNMAMMYYQKKCAYGGELILDCLLDIQRNHWMEGKARNLRNSFPNRVEGLHDKSMFKYKAMLRELKMLESFLSAKIKPEWMIIRDLPILPPEIRKIYEMSNGVLVSADVNDFYRRVIMRNNAIETYFFYEHPKDSILYCYKVCNLQRAVDVLIDNARTEDTGYHKSKRKLISLTERLEGKEGRFRLTLFGKRTDYSGRSVIISGPTLHLDQCGLPYSMAKILFKPILNRKILELPKLVLEKKAELGLLNQETLELEKKKIKYKAYFPTILKLLDKLKLIELLELITLEECILINRAPTLHKFGIQSFFPVIVPTRAIELHPLVCSGYNADFDGDQVGIYLPLLRMSQLELSFLMKPSENLFSPASTAVILTPTQDMVIGMNYLTSFLHDEVPLSPNYYSNEDEILILLQQKKLSLHSRVFIHYSLKNADQDFYNIRDNEFTFFPESFPFLERKVIIYKTVYSSNRPTRWKKNSKFKFVYFLTNIGVLVAKDFFDSTYHFTDLFLETTPGRILLQKTLNHAGQDANDSPTALDINYEKIFFKLDGKDKEEKEKFDKERLEKLQEYVERENEETQRRLLLIEKFLETFFLEEEKEGKLEEKKKKKYEDMLRKNPKNLTEEIAKKNETIQELFAQLLKDLSEEENI